MQMHLLIQSSINKTSKLFFTDFIILIPASPGSRRVETEKKTLFVSLFGYIVRSVPYTEKEQVTFTGKVGILVN